MFKIVNMMVFLLLFTTNCSWARGIGPIEILQKKVESEQTSILIPFVIGLKDAEIQSNVNQLLSGDIDRTFDSFMLNWNGEQHARFWADYSVKYNRNNILSITIEESSKNSKDSKKHLFAHTVNVRSGKEYSLSEVFRPSIKFTNRLESIIKRQCAVRQLKSSFKHIKDNQQFYLMEEGLVIYFQPYEFSSKEPSIIRFVITYDLIKDILNPDIVVM